MKNIYIKKKKNVRDFAFVKLLIIYRIMDLQFLLMYLEKESALEIMYNSKALVLGIHEADFQEVVRTKKH